MQRREFLKSAAVAGVAAAATSNMLGQAQASSASSSSEMQYRQLGRTGEKVSAIGLGGYHIGVQSDPAESVHLVRAAIDRGINFLDNSWDYNNGDSESRMGDALKDGYRNKVLLMTKIDGRTKQAYQQQLEQSLSRLKVDTIDLVQFHEIIRMEDPDRIFAAGGALEAALAAKQAGKIRYIGFTGHKDPAIHLRMFEVAQQHGFHFDTVQMPINVFDAQFRSFAKQVLPVAQAQGAGVLAMKTLGGGGGMLLKSNTIGAIEALHYVLTQPVSVLIAGIDSMQILDQAFTTIKTFKPMNQAEMAALFERTRDASLTGQYELFKTTARFDGTARSPDWLG
jgi:aryl-alcohol dehydrogenase-like predicted oxidoreductase